MLVASSPFGCLAAAALRPLLSFARLQVSWPCPDWRLYFRLVSLPAMKAPKCGLNCSDAAAAKINDELTAEVHRLRWKDADSKLLADKSQPTLDAHKQAQ